MCESHGYFRSLPFCQSRTNPQRTAKRAAAQELKQKKQNTFGIVRDETPVEKVDRLYILERKIIEIFLLYGHLTTVFEDLELKEVDGVIELVSVQQESEVYIKLLLELQEDEIEFANPSFKNIFSLIKAHVEREGTWKEGGFIKAVPPELTDIISDIIMQDEKYKLDDWQRRDIFPKEKTDTVSQLTLDTILNFRVHLINAKIAELQEHLKDESQSHQESLEEIMNYLQLSKLINSKLSRVL